MTAISKTISAFLLAFGLGLAPAFADGGGGGGGDFGSVSARENPDYLAAVSQIDKKNYAEAVHLLHKVLETEPKNADALNYLGFTHRQMGKFDAAVGYYQQALALDPDHLGANEYLGELWLQVRVGIQNRLIRDRLSCSPANDTVMDDLTESL